MENIKNIVEAALFAAGGPLSVDRLLELFEESELKPERGAIRNAVESLQADWEGRGVELCEVASGYRFQVKKDYAEWIGRLWVEKPPRYSRALMETLALVAYRQPITRGEIEDVRGVSVSTSIIKTLDEREWIRVLGHRDVPGRPAMYGTTRKFLDDFNLKSLDQLPPLAEVRDLDAIHDDLFARVNEPPGEVQDSPVEPPVEPPVDDLTASNEPPQGEDEPSAVRPSAEAGGE